MSHKFTDFNKKLTFEMHKKFPHQVLDVLEHLKIVWVLQLLTHFFKYITVCNEIPKTHVTLKEGLSNWIFKLFILSFPKKNYIYFVRDLKLVTFIATFVILYNFVFTINETFFQVTHKYFYAYVSA